MKRGLFVSALFLGCWWDGNSNLMGDSDVVHYLTMARCEEAAARVNRQGGTYWCRRMLFGFFQLERRQYTPSGFPQPL